MSPSTIPRSTTRHPAVVLSLALYALWALAATVAALTGVFDWPSGDGGLLLAVNLVAVAVVFLILVRAVPAVRRAVLLLDPALLTALQGWRILGMMFLFLMVLGELPPLFALPAGIGDVLVGLAAPFLAWRLWRGTASRGAFLGFTVFGLVDFLAAFAAGNAYQMMGEVYGGYASMAAWPLALVPAVFVPTFTVLHLAAWVAWRERG